jgi:hypothetical protein
MEYEPIPHFSSFDPIPSNKAIYRFIASCPICAELLVDRLQALSVLASREYYELGSVTGEHHFFMEQRAADARDFYMQALMLLRLNCDAGWPHVSRQLDFSFSGGCHVSN